MRRNRERKEDTRKPHQHKETAKRKKLREMQQEGNRLEAPQEEIDRTRKEPETDRGIMRGKEKNHHKEIRHMGKKQSDYENNAEH